MNYHRLISVPGNTVTCVYDFFPPLAFNLSLVSTSSCCDSMPNRVTQTFIPEVSEPSEHLSWLGYCSFILIFTAA